MMRKLNTIIIHCSGTPPSMDVGIDELRIFHMAPKAPMYMPKPIFIEEMAKIIAGLPCYGNDWRDVGYHRGIRRNGIVEYGRPIEIQGAHVFRHNSDSVGLCLAGGVNEKGKTDCNYTHAQWDALWLEVETLQARYGIMKVRGHRDFTDKKDCPCFDVPAWYCGLTKEV